MKFLSYVSVPDEPWDIEVINDETTIVTPANKKLVKLNISGRQVSIKGTLNLDYAVLVVGYPVMRIGSLLRVHIQNHLL